MLTQRPEPKPDGGHRRWETEGSGRCNSAGSHLTFMGWGVGEIINEN